MEVQREGTEGSDHDTPTGSPTRDSGPAPRKRRTYRPNLTDAPLHGKRQRVSQACNQCRSKKERCDGQHPACSNCISQKQTCIYGANPKRRGLPAGYIRVVEMLWGLVFCKVAGSEDVVNALLGSTDENGHPDWLVVMKNDEEDAVSMLEIWRKSKAFNLIQRLLTNIEENKERTDEGTAQVSEPTNIPLVWRNASSPVSNVAFDNRPAEKATENDIISLVSEVDHGQPSASRLVSSNSGLEFVLPSNLWHLIEIYFTFTHCWLPILEKHDILRAAHASSGKNFYAGDLGSESGENAALWAVLTYASTQEAALRGSTDSGSVSLNSKELYLKARSLIPSEDSEFDLGHVQALLLLGLYKLGCGSKNAAWLLISHAVRVGIMIGMEGLDGETPVSMPNRSYHVFLGCFILETLISTHTGRLPQLRSESLGQFGTLQEDGLEEWDLWMNTIDQSKGATFERRPLHSLSVFNQLVKLFRILNDLSHERTSNFQYSVYQGRIADWYSQLPEHCRFSAIYDPSDERHSSMLPQIWNLRLMYTSMVALFQTRVLQCQETSSALKIEAKLLIIVLADEIMELLKEYKELYGSSLMPATFVYYVHVAKIAIECYGATGEIFRFKLQFQTLLSGMKRTWLGVDFVVAASPKTGLAMADYQTSLLNPRQPQAIDQSMARPQMDQDNRFPVLPKETAPKRTSNVPEEYHLRSTENFDSTMEGFTTAYPESSATELRPLEHFSIFDQLASLDGAEWMDTQPQFMQNLGFGPEHISSNFLLLQNIMDFAERDIGGELGHEIQP